MANYQSKYTGAQIDEAVGKALASGGAGENGVLLLYDGIGSSGRTASVMASGNKPSLIFKPSTPRAALVTGNSMVLVGSHTDNFWKSSSQIYGINCELTFSDDGINPSTSSNAATKYLIISNVSGLAVVAFDMSSEPGGGDIDPDPV